MKTATTPKKRKESEQPPDERWFWINNFVGIGFHFISTFYYLIFFLPAFEMVFRSFSLFLTRPIFNHNYFF